MSKTVDDFQIGDKVVFIEDLRTGVHVVYDKSFDMVYVHPVNEGKPENKELSGWLPWRFRKIEVEDEEMTVEFTPQAVLEYILNSSLTRTSKNVLINQLSERFFFTKEGEAAQGVLEQVIEANSSGRGASLCSSGLDRFRNHFGLTSTKKDVVKTIVTTLEIKVKDLNNKLYASKGDDGIVWNLVDELSKGEFIKSEQVTLESVNYTTYEVKN